MMARYRAIGQNQLIASVSSDLQFVFAVGACCALISPGDDLDSESLNF
jgi:hypothetical protein